MLGPTPPINSPPPGGFPPQSQDWGGLDLMSIYSGINELLASYSGVPAVLRGTDPAPYARDAAAWWQATSGGSQSLPNAPTVTPVDWFSDQGKKAVGDAFKDFKVGIGGLLLALIIVALGLWLIVKG